jgi:hypothetical protein
LSLHELLYCCCPVLGTNKTQGQDDVSGIIFIRYAPNRKIGKPNNLKSWDKN